MDDERSHLPQVVLFHLPEAYCFIVHLHIPTIDIYHFGTENKGLKPVPFSGFMSDADGKNLQMTLGKNL